MRRDHPWPGVVSAVGYRTPVPDHPVHYGLPSPWLTVIFSLDDGVESASTLDGLTAARPDPIVAAGLHTRCSFVVARPEQSGVQLAVHPLACRALFGVPAAELSVSEYDGTELLGHRAVTTQQQLTEVGDWVSSFRVLDAYLRRSLDRARDDVRSEVLHAWHLLNRSGGRASVTGIAETVGLTPRHLGTLFRREVGRSPKQVAGLFRFQGAVTAIRSAVAGDRQLDLAAVAAATGYADHSHLTHDFVDRLGVPPTRWIAEEFRNLQDHRRWAGPDSGHD